MREMEFSVLHSPKKYNQGQTFSLDSSLNKQSLTVIKLNVNYHTFPCISIFLKYFFVMLNIKISISGRTTCIFFLFENYTESIICSS